MIIVKSIEQYDMNNIYFCDPIKNNIVDDGKFIKILYSTSNFILNGIYLLINFNDINIERYYNKYKCNFNVNTHEKLIESIKNIENKLLDKYGLFNKIPHYKIYEQIKNGNIKLFCDNLKKNTNNSFILKISGLWETEVSYGLTYKFIKVN
jgi:hypothetical protein